MDSLIASELDQGRQMKIPPGLHSVFNPKKPVEMDTLLYNDLMMQSDESENPQPMRESL